MGATCSAESSMLPSDSNMLAQKWDDASNLKTRSLPTATRRLAARDSRDTERVTSGHARTNSGSLVQQQGEKRHVQRDSHKMGAHLLAFLRSQDSVTAYTKDPEADRSSQPDRMDVSIDSGRRRSNSGNNFAQQQYDEDSPLPQQLPVPASEMQGSPQQGGSGRNPRSSQASTVCSDRSESPQRKHSGSSVAAVSDITVEHQRPRAPSPSLVAVAAAALTGPAQARSAPQPRARRLAGASSARTRIQHQRSDFEFLQQQPQEQQQQAEQPQPVQAQQQPQEREQVSADVALPAAARTPTPKQSQWQSEEELREHMSDAATAATASSNNSSSHIPSSRVVAASAAVAVSSVMASCTLAASQVSGGATTAAVAGAHFTPMSMRTMNFSPVPSPTPRKETASAAATQDKPAAAAVAAAAAARSVPIAAPIPHHSSHVSLDSNSTLGGGSEADSEAYSPVSRSQSMSQSTSSNAVLLPPAIEFKRSPPPPRFFTFSRRDVVASVLREEQRRQQAAAAFGHYVSSLDLEISQSQQSQAPPAAAPLVSAAPY